MILIHQLSKVGGDLLNQSVEYFSISDFDLPYLSKFNPKMILIISKVEVPSLATSNAVTISDGFNTTRYDNPSIAYFMNTTPVLPSLPKSPCPSEHHLQQISSFSVKKFVLTLVQK